MARFLFLQEDIKDVLKIIAATLKKAGREFKRDTRLSPAFSLLINSPAKEVTRFMDIT